VIEDFVDEFEGGGGVAGVFAEPQGCQGADGKWLEPRRAANSTSCVELEHKVGGPAHVPHEPSHRLLVFGEEFVEVTGSFELPPPVGEGDVVVGVLLIGVEKWSHYPRPGEAAGWSGLALPSAKSISTA